MDWPEFFEMLTYINRISRAIDRSFVLPAIAYIIGGSIVFIFLWWAVRKAFRAIIQATTKGRGKI